jgi:uncharacterized protein (DUF488 family)
MRRWSCPTSEQLPVFTIGHSTRTIPEFAAILAGGAVELVIDVRTIPRSRTNPQYNFDVLGSELEPSRVGYGRIAQLGGLRGRTREVDPSVNAYWQNRSFHNYADHALGDAFAEGLDELLAIAAGRTTAIMCSEAVWWRCHRRIIADYLLLKGRPVRHLMGSGRIETASMTPGARERDGRLVYPASPIAEGPP